jgi:flagellar motility protein MotE (MotC chaperone)
MDRNLQTKIHKLSDDQFAQAVKEATGINQQEAKKLVKIYRNMNANNGEETLEEVIGNLELDADISVREGGA